MSLQWTIVAGILYGEIAIVVVLLLPFISPGKWNSVFKSKFLRSIGNMSQFYFRAVLAILVLLFIDAYRDQLKYYRETTEHSKSDHGVHLDADMQAHMRMFRAQRNIYISGFSLLLWIVIRRLSTLISNLAMAQVERDAALKQAKSASDAASTYLKGSSKDSKTEEKSKPVEDKRLVESLEKENCRLNAEYTSALKQAESVGSEYDRLLKEHEALQKKYDRLVGESHDKKSD